MKRQLATVSVCGAVLAAAISCAAATGESWKSTGSLSATPKTFTLVPEKNLDYDSKYDDPDSKYYDTGCYYFKVSCKRGKVYTIWTEGLASDNSIRISVDPIGCKWYEDNPAHDCSASFSDVTLDYEGYRGNDYYLGLDPDTWDYDEDPSSVSFIVYVEGEIGETVRIAFKEGVEKPQVSPGIPENPQKITVPEKGDGVAADLKLIDGEYYFTAYLEAGTKYKFWTEGGYTDEEEGDFPLLLDVYEDDEVESAPELKPLTVGVGEFDEGWVVVPSASGVHWFVVSGDYEQDFSLHYGRVAGRTPVEHTEAIEIKEITAAGFVDEVCVPGHRNNPESGFFDQIIDEQLYKVTLEKGFRYAFFTAGAKTNLVMELYEATGSSFKLVNRGTTVSDYDCLISFLCEKKGVYYVGVCEDLADDEEDEPTYGEITFAAALVGEGEGLMDDWDPRDDTVPTGLNPGMGEWVPHGPHTFGIADVIDQYSIGARNGITYGLRATLDDTAPGYDARMTGFKLRAFVYNESSKSKDQMVIEDLLAGGEFTASANANYIIEVTLTDADGHPQPGLDFGPYALESRATGASGLGALLVDIKGGTDDKGEAKGGWTIVSPVTKGVKEPEYKGGQSVFLPAGDYTIAFTKVTGWTQPANLTVTVESGEVRTVSEEAKYCDTCDVVGNDAAAGDGSPTGKKLTTLKPSGKEQMASRSLWTNDDEDWFKVSVAANTYYSFAFADAKASGDAEITVYRGKDRREIIACGTDIFFLCREAKADYYLCVAHRNPSAKEDSQYTLRYTMKQVGAIAFAKAAVSVKDSAASVDLTVNRSGGKDGRVRVRYTTVAGSAEPGVHYEARNGYLEWADGDSKAKTVSVGLIPALVPAWHADRTFSVQLATLTEDELSEYGYADELKPALGTPTRADVTVTAVAKKTTGTVDVTGFGADDEPFANPKKPAVSMPAGEDLVLWLARTGGSDGKVGVTVAPGKGTAEAGVHYDETPVTVVWEHGDAEPKSVRLATYATDEEYMTAKTLTVKIAADKTVSSDTAKVGTSSVSVTLNDPKVTQTVETYAAGTTKDDGIAVKAGKADTWYFNEVGDLTSVTPDAGGKAELTVTLTGNGRFTCRPTFENGGNPANTCTMTVGKAEPVTLVAGEELEVKEYVTKSATVKFTVTRDKKDASDAPVALTFADMGDGEPFAWKRLPSAELVMPLGGEVSVAASACACQDPGRVGKVELRWTVPEDPEIVQLFTLDVNKSRNLGTDKALFPYEVRNDGHILIPVYCADCVDDPRPGELASGATYIWRVDTTFADADCSVTNVSSTAWTINPILCEGVPLAVVRGGTDAYGQDISKLEKVGSAIPVRLVQGVNAMITLGGQMVECEEIVDIDDATFAEVKGFALPKGLSLKNGVIAGVPSASGAFTTIIQASQKQGRSAVAGGTLTLAFEVEPLNLAAGTFNGVLATEDERLLEDAEGNIPPEAVNAFGSATVTTDEEGKISAKLTLGANKPSFSVTGWNRTVVLDNGQPGVEVTISNVETLVTSTKPKVSQMVTNVLTLVACRGAEDDQEALDRPMALTLVQSMLDSGKTAVIDDVSYEGTLYRDNKKVESQLAALAPFVGYYTVSLIPQVPVTAMSGYGYLTLTIDAKGGVKLAGLLPDGVTKPSASSVAYRSENEDTGTPELIVPICFADKGGKNVLFGNLAIRLDEEDVPFVVTSGDCPLVWINTDPATTYDGEAGFRIDLDPVGGFYNTIYNLQAFYYGWDFIVREVDFSEIADDLLGDNEDFVCWPGKYPDYLSLVGDAISVPKQVKVTRDVTVGKKTVKLTDWERTVNPSNLSLSFKHATGIYSGSFEIYAGNKFDDEGLETEQVKLGGKKGFACNGVLLLKRDESSAFAFEDAVMPGFYTTQLDLPIEDSKKTRPVTASLPFVIAPEERMFDWENPDWREEFPVGANEDELDD